jgi:hypothetical protein
MWPAELRPRANRAGPIEIEEHKFAIDASAILGFLPAFRLFGALLLLRPLEALLSRGARAAAPQQGQLGHGSTIFWIMLFRSKNY